MSKVFEKPQVITEDNVTYLGYWPGFLPSEHLFHILFKDYNRNFTIIGPFYGFTSFQKNFLRQQLPYKADFFITGENKPPRHDIAKRQIGFWSTIKRNDVFRFPYWKWHLQYPGITPTLKYSRYGMPLSLERLTNPISEFYSPCQLRQRRNRAVMFSTHLKKPRKSLFALTNQAIGCDGYGRAFVSGQRIKSKINVLEEYRFSLCPENQIGDGYITEKVPEAFHSGTIPIVWCRNQDLIQDFNPLAVVNLYGLTKKEIFEILTEIAFGVELYTKLISQPLLTREPSLNGLIKFIEESV